MIQINRYLNTVKIIHSNWMMIFYFVSFFWQKKNRTFFSQCTYFGLQSKYYIVFFCLTIKSAGYGISYVGLSEESLPLKPWITKSNSFKFRFIKCLLCPWWRLVIVQYRIHAGGKKKLPHIIYIQVKERRICVHWAYRG